MRGHSWFTEGSLCCYMLPRSWLPVEKTNNSTLAWQGPYKGRGGAAFPECVNRVYYPHTQVEYINSRPFKCSVLKIEK